MTYQELKTALKSFQSLGYEIPALNSKKEILESALAELQVINAVAEAAIAEVLNAVVEDTIVPIEATPEVIPAVEGESAPVAIVLSPVPAPKRIRPEHPAISELRELARITEIVLFGGITILVGLIRFAIPHLIRGLGIALRITIATAVIVQVWIVPKIKLAGYLVGCWVLEIALRVIRWRGVAIA